MFTDNRRRFSPDTGNDGGSGDDTGARGDGEPQGPQTWDEALETLDEPLRELYSQHVTGLQNTVKATRTERDTLKARLDALVQGLDGQDPAEVKRQLTEMQGDLQTANARAAFFEEAGKSECRNPTAAWAIAQAQALFDARGNPDWSALREVAPELFGRASPPGNAGAGVGNEPPAKTSMDDWIRSAAGRT